MLLCVVGPTACYKSETAVNLAKHFNGEIISCDSVAVFRGMDIGSAKPDREEQLKIKHHLIDVADPSDRTFTVSSYRDLADLAISNCLHNHKLPIVCGGSGLYFDSVMHDMQYVCPSSPAVRNDLENEYDDNPLAFQAKLKSVDERAAARIPLNDKKRLIRAMEVYILTGTPFSDSNKAYLEAQSRFRYESIRIGLNLPRDVLYARIDARVDKMIQKGLVHEVEVLANDGLDLSFPSMQSIGYKQIYMYLQGVYSLEEAVDEIKKATRHLAKRQITWFKRDSGMVWFDCSEKDSFIFDIIRYVEEKIYA